jgi:S1-C subfamily serine protease
VVALVGVAVLGAAAVGGWAVGSDDEGDTPTTIPSTVPRTTVGLVNAQSNGSPAASGTIDVAAVASAVRPSVVTVSGTVTDGQQLGEAVGTGVIISEDGEILTNAHVIAGAQEVRVRFAGDTEPPTAEVVAVDPGNDLALLRVDVDEPLTAATFADPAALRLGEPVVAIGFALDLDGDPTVTAGIISAFDRTLPIGGGDVLDGLVQTDAAISSGNSGGPLVSAAGEIVGINTAVAQSDVEVAATNVGFAISVGEINEALPALRSGEQREPGFLGVELGNRTDGGQGAVVAVVVAGSPAESAGVREGDVVVEVDGQPIHGGEALRGVIRDHSPGDQITIVVVRDGSEQTLTATLSG